MKALQNLAPFFFSAQGKWGNLLCGVRFHFHGTCSMEVLMCKGFGRDLGPDLARRLFGYPA
jgi:hypothetical protein